MSFITLHFTLVFFVVVALKLFFHLISIYSCLEIITRIGNSKRVIQGSDFGRFYCTFVMKAS